MNRENYLLVSSLMARARRDLSPFLVHLTRDYQGTPAEDNLVSIVTGGLIEARNPYGIAIRHLEQIQVTDDSALATQKVAVFPKPHLTIFTDW